MPAPRGMKELLARKRALIAQAELYRELGALERLHLEEQGARARQFVADNRWWLVGGAAIGGLWLTRRGRGLAGWLPTIVSVVRAFGR